MDVVDIIFLDIDGVLLPFGGVRDGYIRDGSFAEGCIFPNSAMDALTSLLRGVRCLELYLLVAGGISRRRRRDRPGQSRPRPVVHVEGPSRIRRGHIM
ncbi:hypothetical protein ACHAWF_007565 [Thalassiosira exigua]